MSRNPIARVVRSIRRSIIPDKRQQAFNEMVAESERLGLYEHQQATRKELSFILRDGVERRVADLPYKGPDKRELIDE